MFCSASFRTERTFFFNVQSIIWWEGEPKKFVGVWLSKHTYNSQLVVLSHFRLCFSPSYQGTEFPDPLPSSLDVVS